MLDHKDRLRYEAVQELLTLAILKLQKPYAPENILIVHTLQTVLSEILKKLR